MCDFVDSSATSLDLTPDLNSHDRLVVHEFAEEVGLIHESVGEGKERHICLKKIRAESAATKKKKEKEPGTGFTNLSKILMRLLISFYEVWFDENYNLSLSCLSH